MAADFYQRAKEIFLEICDAPGRRDAILEGSCAGDDRLRAEVESLLDYDGPEDGLLAATDALAPGTRFASFTIVRQIGAGGMGIVYEARQESPERSVALKVVRTGVAGETLRRRLELEARALARLQHPGIAAVHEIGVDPGSGAPYIAMELVIGEPLTRFAESRGLGLRERVELLAGVCDAVQHAHQRGVIHRDLKPSNIVVDGAARARVLDFGIARIIEQDPERTLRTMAGQVIGTLAYMSPEQGAGDPEAVDVRADVYALGALGYELLGGAPPLDVAGKPIPEALRTIQEVEPRRLGAVDRRLRGDIETIIAKALEKSAERRYPSAAGLAGDLRRAMRDEPITARTPTTMYQLRKFARRRRGLVAAVTAIAATLVAALVISVVFAVHADTQRDRAQRRFGDVRTLANTVLFDIHDLIAPLAGSIEARRRLVETGLAYLDSLASEAGDDPALLGEVAEGYRRIGDLQGNPRGANLGDVDAALSSYERAAGIRRRLAEVDRSADAVRKLAGVEIAIGETLAASDRSESSGDRFERALALLEGLDLGASGAGESDRAALAMLATVQRRLSEFLREQGRSGEALTHARASLEVAERLFALTGSDDAVGEMTLSSGEVGLVLTELGRREQATAHQQRSLLAPIRRQEAVRTHARVRRDVALTYHRLAAVSAAEGELERALATNRHALEIMGEVAGADPADAGAQFDLSTAQEKVGDALMDLDRAGEAAGFYESAGVVRAELAEENPDNLLYRRAHAGALDRLGLALQRTNEHEAAREAHSGALGVARRCAELDPGDARAWTLIAAAQRGLGESHLAEAKGEPGQMGAARDWFRASLESLSEMKSRGMAPVRGDINEEEIGALLAQCSGG